jgi:hypothetical protein
MLVEIRPTFRRPLHGTFAHVVRPLLALVGRNVTFEESPRHVISSRPYRWECQFAVTHTLSFSSSIANMSANLLAWS